MSVLLGMLQDLDERGQAPQLGAGVAASIEAPPDRRAARAQRRAGKLRLALLLAGIAILAGSALYFWLPAGHREGGAGLAVGTVHAPAVLPAPPPAAIAPASIAPPPVATASVATPVTVEPPTAPPTPTATATIAIAAEPAPAAAKRTAPPPRTTLASIADLPHAQRNANAATAVSGTEAGEGVVRRADAAEPVTMLAHAYDLAAHGRNVDALETLRRTVQQWPANAEARLALASLLAETGQQDAAMHVLLDGAALDAGRFGLAAARLQAQLGAPAAALQTLDSVPAQQRDVEFHAISAAIAQRAERHDIAVREFRLAISAGPARALWWVGLGASLEQLNQPADALAAYKQAQLQGGASAAAADFAAQRIGALASITARAAPAPAVATTP